MGLQYSTICGKPHTPSNKQHFDDGDVELFMVMMVTCRKRRYCKRCGGSAIERYCNYEERLAMSTITGITKASAAYRPPRGCSRKDDSVTGVSGVNNIVRRRVVVGNYLALGKHVGNRCSFLGLCG